MEKRIQYEHLKRFIVQYGSRKIYDPMMLRIFKILLADLESEIISEIKGRKQNGYTKG